MSVAMYVSIDGIKGESQAQGFTNQILAKTLYLGGTSTTSVNTNSGSGAGRAAMDVIKFSKTPDSATTNLFIAMCTGKHFPSATISLVKAGASKAYLEFKLTEVYLTVWNLQNSDSEDEVPTENVAMSYSKIQITYLTQNAQGNLTSSGIGTWDVKANKAS